MKTKKTNKANLEKSRGIFLSIGLIAALLIVLAIFEKSTKAVGAEDLGSIEKTILDEEQIPITREMKTPPPPPPKESVSDIIEIMENEVKIEDELSIDLETEDNTAIKFTDMVLTDETDPDPDIIFTIVADMPEYPGGDLALRKKIANTIIYPEMAKENDIQGTVYVRFVVTKKGNVTDVKILRGVDPLLDNEAIRVVKTLKGWTPGKQRNEPVNVSYSLPIKFKLQ